MPISSAELLMWRRQAAGFNALSSLAKSRGVSASAARFAAIAQDRRAALQAILPKGSGLTSSDTPTHSPPRHPQGERLDS